MTISNYNFYKGGKRILTCLAFAFTLVSGSIFSVNAQEQKEPVCLYISSYHQGFEWSDGIQSGISEVLGNSCRIVQFDMDTKRQKSMEHAKLMAKKANALIKAEQPDVVITSDDNAAKYVILPYLKNTNIPVVFSGVNWTVEEYGFPLPNVTGIVEVAPIQPMIKQARKLLPAAERALYLGPNTLTESKNFERYKQAGVADDIKITARLVDTFEQWKEALVEAQNYDFVVIGSHSGIPNWNAAEAEKHALAVTRTLSLTTHDWMMPVTSIGFTTLPEEQGQWAASTALAILEGVSPTAIPIVTNRKWDAWVNGSLLDATGVQIEQSILARAKLY